MLYVSKDRPFDDTPLAPLDPALARNDAQYAWYSALADWLLVVGGIACLVLLAVAFGA